MKYRIKIVQISDEVCHYWVEKKRPLFFFFGPKIWVDAISWDDCMFGVPYFSTYKDAKEYVEKQLYAEKVTFSEEFGIDD